MQEAWDHFNTIGLWLLNAQRLSKVPAKWQLLSALFIFKCKGHIFWNISPRKIIILFVYRKRAFCQNSSFALTWNTDHRQAQSNMTKRIIMHRPLHALTQPVSLTTANQNDYSFQKGQLHINPTTANAFWDIQISYQLFVGE